MASLGRTKLQKVPETVFNQVIFCHFPQLISSDYIIASMVTITGYQKKETLSEYATYRQY